jgi:hypothetical protein
MRTICLALLVLPGVSVAAETVIHRCAQEDGTVAFQETPCAGPASEGERDDPGQSAEEEAAPVDESFDFVNPFDVAEQASVGGEPERPSLPSQDRVECEKTTRDAIDAIDLAMREGYTDEEGREYLAELLELTQQLRACKQL